MRKNAFIAMDHIAALNEFREHSIQSGDLPLSEDSLRNAFKACGIPSNSLFFLEFRNSGLLVKVEKDMYAWKDTLPIHHQALQSIYSRYQKRAREYANIHYTKIRMNKESKEKEIEKAIKLLKENGFEIFTPCHKLYKRI